MHYLGVLVFCIGKNKRWISKDNMQGYSNGALVLRFPILFKHKLYPLAPGFLNSKELHNWFDMFKTHCVQSFSLEYPQNMYLICVIFKPTLPEKLFVDNKCISKWFQNMEVFFKCIFMYLIKFELQKSIFLE